MLTIYLVIVVSLIFYRKFFVYLGRLQEEFIMGSSVSLATIGDI